MAVSDIFRKVPVEIPNKSGFDMSHEHNFTAKVGTLTPAMVDMLLPNDSISLSVGSEIQLPPMATDFYGRVKAHFEAFFVPFRILDGAWQDIITHQNDGTGYPPAQESWTPRFLPTLVMPAGQLGVGSLADYLGYGFAASPDAVTTINVPNPLKFLAYHKIWDDFYRDSRLQHSAFVKPVFDDCFNTPLFRSLPYSTRNRGESPAPISGNSLKCADGVFAYSLRQRAWGKDYFTNATPLPQAGSPASVAFGIDTQAQQGAFTIASLRAANSLQQWLERNNVAGMRYGDQIRAQFGVYPTDAALDRPLYLGRQIIDVYNKSVYQNDGNTAESRTNNPFSSVGAKYGSPLGVGSGKLVDNFTAKEHGYIFVMFSLVPDAIYSDILDRDFWYNKMSDFPFPLLAGVGDQAITLDELVGYATDNTQTLETLHSQVFAYTQRYANHKFKLDRVSGLLKDGNSLASFALQRGLFADGAITPALGSDFIEIPTNYLDQVAAVDGDVSKYGCWAENHFTYHKASTLPAYSVPTLGEPKNTHTEVVPNGGIRL